MRRSTLSLIAVCITLLWVETGSAQIAGSGTQALLSKPAKGCAFPFEPQRFPATGQTTVHVVGDDGYVRAGGSLDCRDNGDGTITDENSDLMWEKKDQASAGLQNWNNTYPWQGTCSNNSKTLCGTDADCSNGGSCVAAGGKLTIFQCVAELNTPPCLPAIVTGGYPTSRSCKAS